VGEAQSKKALKGGKARWSLEIVRRGRSMLNADQGGERDLEGKSIRKRVARGASKLENRRSAELEKTVGKPKRASRGKSILR